MKLVLKFVLKSQNSYIILFKILTFFSEISLSGVLRNLLRIKPIEVSVKVCIKKSKFHNFVVGIFNWILKYNTFFKFDYYIWLLTGFFISLSEYNNISITINYFCWNSTFAKEDAINHQRYLIMFGYLYIFETLNLPDTLYIYHVLKTNSNNLDICIILQNVFQYLVLKIQRKLSK